MFKWLILVGGVGFLLFQIFINQGGGKSKFKSDLPKPPIRKGSGPGVS